MRDIDGTWQTLRERRAEERAASRPSPQLYLAQRQTETTARYAHLVRESVHETAARIAGSIAADLL